MTHVRQMNRWGYAAAGIQLLIAYACEENGTAHAAMLDGGTGEPFWEQTWTGAETPRFNVVHEHPVTSRLFWSKSRRPSPRRPRSSGPCKEVPFGEKG